MSRLSPINQARWARFRRNRRGYWSLWIFLVLFTLSLAADLIANDKPLLVRYEGRLYLPFMINYSETAFGGELNTEADYQDPFVQQQIERHGWAVWAPIRFSYDTINFATEVPFPSPPSRHNLLGTDSNGGDVLARVLYGFRISMLFGLALTLFSSLIGVCVGATGVLRRAFRSVGATLYRSVVGHADAVSDHSAVEYRPAQFLVAARHHHPVRLDEPGGGGARRIPAHPQF